MRSPFPPAWPWQVEPELALLAAFVNIVEANASRGQRVGPCLECDGLGIVLIAPGLPVEVCGACGGVDPDKRSHAGDAKAMEAAFATALRRLEAREQGRLSAADRRRDGRPLYVMTDELRALFGQPDPVRALIGHRDGATDVWVNGLAKLTEMEQAAYWHHLHGMSRSAIALMLVPTRAQRFGRAGALPLTTVSQYLWRARVKLRAVFARLPETEAEYLAALDAEEARAELEARNVDPAAGLVDAKSPERDERRFGREPTLDSLADEENPEGEPWSP